jgi:hypothetical protein
MTATVAVSARLLLAIACAGLILAAAPVRAQDGLGHSGMLAPPLCPDPYGCWVAPDGRSADQLVAAHVLPDPRHAGTINPAVTPQTIAKTICTPGWTATVRPPTSYTDKLRRWQTPDGAKPPDGELDHRLSIEDGGHPSDAANLWWQVYTDRYGARLKDVLETRLHRRVCAGTLSLGEAREALLGNWLVAYEKYVGPLPK